VRDVYLLRLVGYAFSAALLLESAAYLFVFGSVELRPPHDKPFNVALLLTNFELWKLFLGAAVSLVLHYTERTGPSLWRTIHRALTGCCLAVYGIGFLFSAVVIFMLRVHGMGLSWAAVPPAFGPAVYLAYGFLCLAAIWGLVSMTHGRRRVGEIADGDAGTRRETARPPRPTQSRPGSISALASALVLILAALTLSGVGCAMEPPPEPELPAPGEWFVEFSVRDVDLEDRVLVIRQVWDPGEIHAPERIPVREDAIITFYKSTLFKDRWGKQIKWRGRLDWIVPGDHGGLILDREGYARFVIISRGRMTRADMSISRDGCRRGRKTGRNPLLQKIRVAPRGANDYAGSGYLVRGDDYVVWIRIGTRERAGLCEAGRVVACSPPSVANSGRGTWPEPPSLYPP